MPREIRRVAVLGAGVMGSGIAAHLANAGISVVMLDIVPPKLGEGDAAKGLTESDPRFRNKFALAGLDNIKKSKPALLYSKRFLPLIEVGNFDDDWDRLADCDWIIEVVVERLDIKQKLFARVDEIRRPGTIVSSNTSGLSIAGMTEGRSDDFKQHFLVTHFFNPVRYMRLLELVAGEATSPEVLEFVADFGRFRLGKGIVYGKDTPNFIGNRIGGFGIAATIRAMTEMDYQVDEVDAITGPAIGHPGSASFGTVDLVGLDVLAHVINTLKEGCPDDEQRDLFELPDFMAKMIEEGALGRKTKDKGGFFRVVKEPDGSKTKLVYDWKSGSYRPKQRFDIPSLGAAKKTHDVARRLRDLVQADDRGGAFAWRLLRTPWSTPRTASGKSRTAWWTSTTPSSGATTGSSAHSSRGTPSELLRRCLECRPRVSRRPSGSSTCSRPATIASTSSPPMGARSTIRPPAATSASPSPTPSSFSPTSSGTTNG